MNNFIIGQIKRTNRNLFLVTLSMAVVLAVISFYYRGPISTILMGGRNFDTAFITSSEQDSTSPFQFVILKGTASTESGWEEYSVRKRRGSDYQTEQLSARYVFVRSGPHLVLVKSPLNESGNIEFEGIAKDIPDEVNSGVRESLAKLMPDESQVLCTVMIDATYSDFDLYFWIPIFFLIILVVLRNFLLWAARYWNHEWHPIARKISQYSQFDEATNEIDRELSELPVLRLTFVTISRSWFFNERFFTVDVFNLRNLVWAYIKSTRHYMNYVHQGTSHEIVFHSIKAKKFSFLVNAPEPDEMLDAIFRRAPWALYGYSEKLANNWKNEHGEIEDFVHERRNMGATDFIGLSGPLPESRDEISNFYSPDKPDEDVEVDWPRARKRLAVLFVVLVSIVGLIIWGFKRGP